MQNSQNKKRLQIFLLVIAAVLTLGIGYASITAVDLIIDGNGTASAVQENFKVYFTDSTITEGKGTASIDEDDATIGYFDIIGLSKVGDSAEAIYTILNDSNSVGADISLQLTSSNKEYFKVTETLADSQLQAGETTTATITVEVIKTPTQDDVSTAVTAKLITNPIDNASAIGNSSSSIEQPTEFERDSWATIKTNVQNGNIDQYNLGDTRTIEIGDNSYRVRLANKTTGEHCGDEDTAYSQTACGFVVEFIDKTTKMKMKSSLTNKGGYPESDIYTYLKDTLYPQLPEDLQSAIKPTRVISGHGSKDTNNFVTTDKLFLLSKTELTEETANDTAASSTHQLEYYLGMKKELYNIGFGYVEAYYKLMRGCTWWLRSPYSTNDRDYLVVYSYGSISGYNASNVNEGGVFPAFRIG